ncbi:YkgJ family cysteine cluster protein [Desulfotomaculum copahuensis]|uniref:Fe-S oxidoreductase n=1 Tax=Desulfotomaculum copahuensis TaxID=1838280 RepID=A0A1B7LH23_9FIRM|nr:YkgJ family cysteine cluster protein [Desulfotomaculum copahuensis]OAT85511.1 hypothetical protein A6M21_06245 [Desulfotomaculum copahuensis]
MDENLTIDSKFKFSCRPGLECFGRCCRDVNIFLTPYDVLRMKKALGISSEEFLAQYTVCLIPEKTGLPVLVLKMTEDGSKRCPFVTANGCQIYQDRPWACRIFPLDRSDNREEEEYRFIASPPRCLGFNEDVELTVDDYKEDQGIYLYEEMERYFQDVTSGIRLEGPVKNRQLVDMFYMSCYNLDKFRRFVFESSFLDKFVVHPELVERIKEDDVELMKFALKWLRFGLAQGDSLLIREEAFRAKQAELAGQLKN